MATGEDWVSIRSMTRIMISILLTLVKDSLLHDFAVTYPNCVYAGSCYGDCGYPALAYVLFIAFYFLCTYIFVNLLTVVRRQP